MAVPMSNGSSLVSSRQEVVSNPPAVSNSSPVKSYKSFGKLLIAAGFVTIAASAANLKDRFSHILAGVGATLVLAGFAFHKLFSKAQAENPATAQSVQKDTRTATQVLNDANKAIEIRDVAATLKCIEWVVENKLENLKQFEIPIQNIVDRIKGNRDRTTTQPVEDIMNERLAAFRQGKIADNDDEWFIIGAILTAVSNHLGK